MGKFHPHQALLFAAAVLALLFGGSFLLGLFFPFLLGFFIAKVSEPGVKLLSRKLPRWLAAGIGVSFTLILGLGLLSMLGAILVRELGQMAKAMPDIRETARQGILLLQDTLINLSNRTPEGIRPFLCHTVLRLFNDGSAMLDKAAGQIPAMIGSLLGKLPDRALSLGTGILAGFLISARLPGIRSLIAGTVPEKLKSRYVPLLQKGRHALGCWFLAQGKLVAITYCIVSLGLMLIGIPYAPVWAFFVALVDAVPMLGTGTILLPWALVKLLKGQMAAALGLAAIYGCALLSRMILEPRLLGRHLGLDPLVTLFFLYLGYRFWGLWGMLLFPMLAGAVKSAIT